MRQFVVAGEALSREDLDERADRFAGRLAGTGVVAVVAHPSIDMIAAIVGAERAGVVAVPMSPESGANERIHVLRDSGASILVDRGSITQVAHGTDTPPALRDASLILYTSGTTGLPKGVPITRTAIDACIDALAQAWEWTPDDVLVHGLPLHHVHGLVLGVLGPLRIGSGLRLCERPTPAAYAESGGSLYFGVPTVWSRIAADESCARALSSARLLVSGSAPLRPATFEALAALTGQRPVERYGMTETLITVSTRARGPREPGVVGTALASARTRLVDEHGDPVTNDGHTIGSLEVAGPTVFGGYHGRPDATSASFTAGGWFRTGDVATIASDGTHRIIGRASTDLIKSGGYRIGAGEIEDALLSHPSVTEAAVVGEPDDDLGQRIIAYVVAHGGNEAELIDHVATQLSRYKRPRRVVFVDALPRNAMGKVEKGGLSGP